MDIDPTTNIVVFEIQGRNEPYLASGPTRDDHCIEQAWSGAPAALQRRRQGDPHP
jgi:hypothetical protein